MNNVTFYHCGDIHFDVPFTTLTGKLGLAKKRRQDIKNTFIKMIDMAVDDKPDFLFIAGDLFEQEYVSLKPMTCINEQIKKILNTKVILIAGNHDSETKNSFYHTMDWNENEFFISEQIEKIYFEKHDTTIYGIGFSIGQGQREKLHNIQCETKMSNILLFHGDVDLEIGNRDYNAVSSELLESIGFDYIAVSQIISTEMTLAKTK
jgi:exonuclease SbcD